MLPGREDVTGLPPFADFPLLEVVPNGARIFGVKERRSMTVMTLPLAVFVVDVALCSGVDDRGL